MFSTHCTYTQLITQRWQLNRSKATLSMQNVKTTHTRKQTNHYLSSHTDKTKRLKFGGNWRIAPIYTYSDIHSTDVTTVTWIDRLLHCTIYEKCESNSDFMEGKSTVRKISYWDYFHAYARICISIFITFPPWCYTWHHFSHTVQAIQELYISDAQAESRNITELLRIIKTMILATTCSSLPPSVWHPLAHQFKNTSPSLRPSQPETVSYVGVQ